MARLKQATAECHRQIETRLGTAERFSNRGRYLGHLEGLAAFHRVAEARWELALSLALHDYPARCKATLLENDVRFLGGQIPDGAPVPPQIDRASALGGFYVLEGASLGGAILLTLARRNLGLSPQSGASYLASYGEDLSRMWQHFGEQVNSQLIAEGDILRAIEAARHTFGALEAWLCRDHPA